MNTFFLSSLLAQYQHITGIITLNDIITAALSEDLLHFSKISHLPRSQLSLFRLCCHCIWLCKECEPLEIYTHVINKPQTFSLRYIATHAGAVEARQLCPKWFCPTITYLNIQNLHNVYPLAKLYVQLAYLLIICSSSNTYLRNVPFKINFQ